MIYRHQDPNPTRQRRRSRDVTSQTEGVFWDVFIVRANGIFGLLPFFFWFFFGGGGVGSMYFGCARDIRGFDTLSLYCLAYTKASGIIRPWFSLCGSGVPGGMEAVIWIFAQNGLCGEGGRHGAKLVSDSLEIRASFKERPAKALANPPTLPHRLDIQPHVRLCNCPERWWHSGLPFVQN